MSNWSDKTKTLLIAVDNAITDFVLNSWQSGSPEKVANAWKAFIISESDDSAAQGYGKRSPRPVDARGFRDVDFFLGENIAFINSLGESDSKLRTRIHLDVANLVQYFAPWDWEENAPKARGYVGADGLVRGTNVNAIRFRVLDEQATLEKRIADAKTEAVIKAADDYAESLGESVSRGTTESIKVLYENNKTIFLAGAGLAALAGVYLIFSRGGE